MSLRRSIRSVDTAARIGGDEFCVLAAGAGPEERGEAGAPASRPRSRRRWRRRATRRSTVSIGVAASPEHGDEAEALIDTADRAMYRAKAAGEGIALGDPPGTSGRDRRRGAPT